ncbi:hypothetical protein [Massilia sp. erpn]|uniref:hypothetical protein n=1 Tax=Massilia sp. erpn TaxID=2738142 RepID=UPI0021073130|nr:hypothetical protein [Massilia sp. erpn]UTY60499.1 hypothetical protein HPQ68_26870 [Massilia sp. erpn]
MPTFIPNATSEDESTLAARHEIRYDGLRYLYRGYRYEHFCDALNYARLDQARAGFMPDPAFVARWDTPWQPDAAQRQQMAAGDVTFASGYYLYGGYRYERLADALACARLGGKAAAGGRVQ